MKFNNFSYSYLPSMYLRWWGVSVHIFCPVCSWVVFFNCWVLRVLSVFWIQVLYQICIFHVFPQAVAFHSPNSICHRAKVFNFFKRFIYLFMRDTHRGRDTGRGEAGSTQGAWRGIPSRDSRIPPWAEGRHLTAEPSRDPQDLFIWESMCKSGGGGWGRRISGRL